MVQRATSDVLLLPLETKKTLLRSQMSGRKTCTLRSALQPGSSEKAQSAPCEETRACLNRAGIIPGTLLAVVAAILPKTLAASCMSTGAGRGCEAWGVCNNSSCLLAIHKKWSELRSVLSEYNHLSFYSGNTSTVTSIGVQLFIYFPPLCGHWSSLLGGCERLSDHSTKQ